MEGKDFAILLLGMNMVLGLWTHPTKISTHTVKNGTWEIFLRRDKVLIEATGINADPKGF